MIDERRGKSAYAVLAANVRMAAVAIWSTTYIRPLPKTALPIWEITVSSWLGYGWRW